MTPEQFQQILAILRQRAILNPYFTFVYDWGIVNSSDRIVTAAEVMSCINAVRFPPMGKN